MFEVRRVVLATLTAVAVAGLGLVPTPADAAPVRYANCTALHKKYPHGVGRKGARDHVSGHTKPVTTFTRNTAVYNAQSKSSDRDHDGIACEKA